MAYLYDLTDTWNAAGTVFNAIKMNVTNSASAAGSKIVSLQVGSTDRFTVDKDGNGYFSGTLQAVGAISFPNAYLSGNSGTIGMQDNTASILAYNGTGSGGITNTLRFITGASERLRIDGSGNIGIGTSSPGAKLEVSGNIKLSAAGNYLTFGNPSYPLYVGDGTSLLFGPNNNQQYAVLRGSTGVALTTDGNPGLFLNSSGNVGIGTASPNAKLTVNGDITSNKFAFYNEGSGANYNYTGYVRFANGGTESMRITSAGDVGIGTSSPANKLDVNGTAGATAYLLNSSSHLIYSGSSTEIAFRIGASGPYYGIGTTGSNNMRINSASGGDMLFSVSGNEYMRINYLGNVGIATSSPGAKLDILGASSDQIRVRTAGTEFYRFGRNSSTGYMDFYGSQTGYTGYTFGGVDGERMRINSDGNVGIGTSSIASLLHVKLGSNATEVYPSGTWATRVINAVDGAANNGLLVGNRWASTNSFVVDFGSIYGNNSGTWSSYYKIDGVGQHFWGVNASGTEGMRLNASGNLGIGTSSPGARLDARAANIADGTNGGIVNVYSTTAQAANVGGKLDLGGLYDGSNSLSFASVAGRKENSTSGDWSGYMQFSTRRFGGDFAERMRIDSSGNVGIGAAPLSFTPLYLYRSGVDAGLRAERVSGAALDMFATASTAYFGTATNHPLLFQTNGSEKARITSSGNFLVGTTSLAAGNWSHEIKDTTTDAWPLALNATTRGMVIRNSSASSGYYAYFEYNGGTNNGSISWSGGTTSYNTTSDARIKTNIVDAPEAGGLIDSMKVRSWDFKADGAHWRYGMVAQELLEVAPEAVSVPADEEVMMGVDYSKLVPMLIKELQSLRARVAQLEGN